MLRVAVGVIANAAGDVLVSQRPEGKPLAGAWEFPGGKLAASETPLAALVRELREELSIEVRLARHLMSYTHDAQQTRVQLFVWRVLAWSGEPRGQEGQRLKWQALDKLMVSGLLSADAPIVAALQRQSRAMSLAYEPCLAAPG